MATAAPDSRPFDHARRKEAVYLVSRLDGDYSSSDLYKALSCLRSYFFSPSSSEVSAQLHPWVSSGVLVRCLLKLLAKPNAKVVDVTLSVLGNLFLSESVRKQLYQKSFRGIPLIVSILTAISEESILCRACRVIANLAQDAKLCHELHQKQIFAILLQVIEENQFVAKTFQVIVRAIRILGATTEQKKAALESKAIAMVAGHLGSDDEDLLKAVTKCLAHFTHGCGMQVAEQVCGDGHVRIKILVELMDHPKRSIWEAAMATTVNLAHVTMFRPPLGNMGAIGALVDKVENRQQLELSPKEIAHCITALCLFCRESVNRMKIRECHGLRLMVAILNDRALVKLHDRIVNSLLQFSFDNASLTTLQNEGLVKALVGFVVAYTKKFHEEHDCLEEISQSCPNLDDPDSSHGPTLSGCLPEMVDDQDVLMEDELPCGIAPPEDVSHGDRDSNLEGDLDDDEIAAMNLEDQNPAPTPAEENLVREQVVFRVNSPSYQAVQDEYNERIRRQEAVWTRSECVSLAASPDRSPYPWVSSPGYSLAGSPVSCCGMSPEKSPSRNSPLTMPTYSPIPIEPQSGEEPDSEDAQCVYSPVERFSDDDEDSRQLPTSSKAADVRDAAAKRNLWESLSPPAAKKPRPTTPPQATTASSPPNVSPTYNLSFNNFSPGVSPLNQAKPLPLFAPLPLPPAAIGSPDRSETREEKRENSMIGWILHLLSLLSQPANIHEHMLEKSTTQAIINYLIRTKNPLPRAGRILIRLSKNIYSTMAFINQRHMSWLIQTISQRSTMAETISACKSCENLGLLKDILVRNISVLTETGYCEGQMCHILTRGSKEDKKSVAVSAAILIRRRKLLRNVLLSHDGLDVLLDVCEVDRENASLFSDAVLSCSSLGAHVGIVAMNLLLDPKEDTNCFYQKEVGDQPKNLSLLLDDGSEFQVNREVIGKASSVFNAMLEGNFVESAQSQIKIPFLSGICMEILLHHLYGCVWCERFKDLDVAFLLELVSVSDQFLLPDLNQVITHEITTRCLNVDQVVNVYQSSLQREYQVHGCKESLSKCAVNYLIVGEMKHEKRVELWSELMKSRARSDFVDDVGKILRAKLLEFH